MKGIPRLSLLLLLAQTAKAFLPTDNRKSTTHLPAHISGWRDLMFDAPQELAGDTKDGEPVREVCILPFPLTDVLLQGETKELCLYEERFHKLFEKAMRDHAGIVAMGFIAPPSGMLQGMPLCDIESFRTMEGDTGFGDISILATIRVVGRATLLDVETPEDESILEGYMTGWCQELIDDVSQSSSNSDQDMMEVYNDLADECDILFESIVFLQEKIKSLEGQQQSEALKNGGGSSGENEVLSEATLRRMKLEAELGLDDDDEDDDDDDDYLDLDDDEVTGPRSALKKAVQIAKVSDTQGYTIGSPSLSGKSGDSAWSTTTQTKRSIQDLTAASWGYLSKDVWGEEEVSSMRLLKYRLQALNTNDLSDRFILVSKMMVEEKKFLMTKLDKLSK